MRIGYLECFAGIAGDMFLGALVDSGVPQEVLVEATAALNIGAILRFEKVDRSGISCTKVHVLENGHAAEHSHGRAEQEDLIAATFSILPKTQHQHKTGHPHTHEHEPVAHSHDHHEHTHGRSLSVIRTLIQQAALAPAVKDGAIRTFELLGASEAKIHNVPVEQIHFHEVGAVDAIVDIVASWAGIVHLGVDAWYCSSINVGGGTVECAHGTFPVPAPATADLLRGLPTYSAHLQKELVTPTGAALIRALNPAFGAQPPMSVEKIGYGAGTRNPHGFANVLRLSVGEAAVASATWLSSSKNNSKETTSAATVTVIETALDDLSPQVLASVTENLLSLGALDAMLTPVIMKKGRPGTLLTVLCSPDDAEKLADVILRETSTLGLRIRQDKRVCLERNHVTVTTEYGPIAMKIGCRGGEVLNVAPEFEDCRKAAAAHGVPVKQVQQAAIAAYFQQHAEAGA